MLNEQTWAALDKRLLALHHVLVGGDLNAAVTLAREILDASTQPEKPGKAGDGPGWRLLPRTWKSHWNAAAQLGTGQLVSGWFGTRDPERGAEGRALLAAFESLVQFIPDSATAHQRNRHAAELQVLLADYLDLRDLLPKNPAGASSPGGPGNGPPQYVTLDQVAALVNRSKKTMERLKTRQKNPLPPPDVEGGGGKPDEWDWLKVRPWLASEYRKILPERFPVIR